MTRVELEQIVKDVVTQNDGWEHIKCHAAIWGSKEVYRIIADLIIERYPDVKVNIKEN
jgi:hypothetical protein